jgi:hypothetical protein
MSVGRRGGMGEKDGRVEMQDSPALAPKQWWVEKGHTATHNTWAP